MQGYDLGKCPRRTFLNFQVIRYLLLQQSIGNRKHQFFVFDVHVSTARGLLPAATPITSHQGSSHAPRPTSDRASALLGASLPTNNCRFTDSENPFVRCKSDSDSVERVDKPEGVVLKTDSRLLGSECAGHSPKFNTISLARDTSMLSACPTRLEHFQSFTTNIHV